MPREAMPRRGDAERGDAAENAGASQVTLRVLDADGQVIDELTGRLPAERLRGP